jgi:hypothetical protein
MRNSIISSSPFPISRNMLSNARLDLGVTAVDGGAHPGLGTANALLGLELGDELTESLGLTRQNGPNPLTYLEILGPDPEQDPALAAGRLAGITTDRAAVGDPSGRFRRSSSRPLRGHGNRASTSARSMT